MPAYAGGGARWRESRRLRDSRCPHTPGLVGVAHSRTLRVGGNRGITRNSTVSSGHGRAPMCADPPHRTWEPDHHTPRSPENPVIPTKNSPRPAKTPPSHVQHQRQPHPPQTQARTRPNSKRSTTELEASLNRTRHGARPNSTTSADADGSTGYCALPDRLIGSLGATGSDRQHRSAC